MSDLAKRVRRYRLEQQLSVREVASRAGVSVSYVYAIESGDRGNNLIKLGKVAKALGVSLSQLWDEA